MHLTAITWEMVETETLVGSARLSLGTGLGTRLHNPSGLLSQRCSTLPHDRVFPHARAEPSKLQIVALVLFAAFTEKSLLHHLWKHRFEQLLHFPCVLFNIWNRPSFPKMSLLVTFSRHLMPLIASSAFPLDSRCPTCPGWHILEWSHHPEQRVMITSLYLMLSSFTCRPVCSLPMGSSYKVRRKLSRQGGISVSLRRWETL